MKKHTHDRPGTPGKKLAFEKETLRTLGSTDLGQVAGGRIEPTSSGDCPG